MLHVTQLPEKNESLASTDARVHAEKTQVFAVIKYRNLFLFFSQKSQN
jgi:hypothetical protein